MTRYQQILMVKLHKTIVGNLIQDMEIKYGKSSKKNS